MTEAERIQRIEADISEHKLGMKAVSLAAGLNETFVRDMLKRGRAPSAKNLEAVEAAIQQLIGRVPLDPTPQEVRRAGVEPQGVMVGLRKDIEVMGTVAGAEMIGKGAFRISNEPVDRAFRPPGLADAKGVYSLFVEGTSMSPMYEPGELIFVSSNRPPRPGDVVIVQDPMADGSDYEGYLKIFVRKTAEHVIVRQLQPEGELKFKNHPALRLHRVYTNNELFGL